MADENIDDDQNEYQKSIQLHVEGATVRHAGIFSDIEVPQLMDSLTQEVIDKWVKPFYMVRLHNEEQADAFASALHPLASEINLDLLTALLSDFNWRPRIVAAYFAAILKEQGVEDHIGKLLLRSDVCAAGRGYCLALSRLNTDRSLSYLTEYLDYYLTRTDLNYDQSDVIAAVAYLDKVNKTDVLSDFIERWNSFTKEKPHLCELSEKTEYFEERMNAIQQIAEKIAR